MAFLAPGFGQDQHRLLWAFGRSELADGTSLFMYFSNKLKKNFVEDYLEDSVYVSETDRFRSLLGAQ